MSAKYVPINQPLDKLVSSRENETIVRVSNTIAQRSAYELTLTEHKLMLFILTRIDPMSLQVDSFDGPELTFKINDFCKFVGIPITQGSSYRNVRNSIKTLADRSVYIDIGDGNETLVRWFAAVVLNKKNASVTVTISRQIRPYITNLREHYTQFAAAYTTRMQSKYAVRLYQFLHSYINITEMIVIKTTEMIALLSCKKDIKVYDLKRNVLDVAVREINEYTDIKCSYEFIIEGRNYKEIKFSVHKASLNERQEHLDEIDKLLGVDLLTQRAAIESGADYQYANRLARDGKVDKADEYSALEYIPYAAGASKPILRKVLLSHMDYDRLCSTFSDKENEAFEILIKTLCRLGSQHRSGDVTQDGGNVQYIDAFNDILKKEKTFDPWIVPMVVKYSTFWDTKKSVADPVAYMTKSVSNDLLEAEVIIQRARSITETKQSVDHLAELESFTSTRKRRLKRTD